MAAEDGNVHPVLPEETELEVTCRYSDTYTYWFVINLKETDLPLPRCLAGGRDLLSGAVLEQDRVLKPYDVVIIPRT